MVRSDIGDNGNVRTEIIHVVKLETTYFEHVIVIVAGCHLICVALAYVAAEARVEPGFLEQIVYKGSSCRLSVGSGDADFFRIVIS